MKAALPILLAAGLAAAPPAAADADGPDNFLVRDPHGAAVRAEPRADAALLGALAPDYRPVRNLGCSAVAPGWCKVSRDGLEGWARAPQIGEYPYPLHPSFDCARASHEAELLICGDAGLTGFDNALATTYVEARSAAAALGETAALAAEQHGWVRGRNDCWKADDKPACITEAYARRISFLRARWQIDPPDGLAVYRCDGGGEVAAAFFNAGPRPAARVAFDGRTEVFVGAPAASGARYEGDFGKFLWTKGKRALLVWDQFQPQLTCTEN